MILLDTNALIWLMAGHPRVDVLAGGKERLAVSPASLLELQFLVEVGRIQFAQGQSVATISRDRRWRVDNPSSSALFEAALQFPWTRDPFDRLLVAHATLRRWKLATGDKHLIESMGPESTVRL